MGDPSKMAAALIHLLQWAASVCEASTYVMFMLRKALMLKFPDLLPEVACLMFSLKQVFLREMKFPEAFQPNG